MKKIAKLLNYLPMRPRAFVALLIFLLIFWLPLVAGIAESFHWVSREVADNYRSWVASIKMTVAALVSGERQPRI